MPFDDYAWFPTRETLTFEEITRVVRAFVGLGVEKVRLTGGEPLLRAHLEDLVRDLSRVDGLQELCLTTNGSMLADKAEGLRAAGLTRLNVSLDTLDPAKFERIRRRGDLSKVLDGIFAAQRVGLRPIKINAVIERGVNDDDIIPLVEFGREHGFSLRFIEFMDVGNANAWSWDRVVPKREILGVIAARYPLREVGREKGTAPSVTYEFEDGRGDVGVIASVTEPFCGSCTRARVTADGKVVTCLFSDSGHDIRALLRGGATDEALSDEIAGIWRVRTDRYSEQRLAAHDNGSGYEPAARRKIEMITLGG
jgi:cyclic pyranopterin phosphate synthase